MDKKIANKKNIIDKKITEKNNKYDNLKKNIEQQYKKYKEGEYFQLLWLVP
jgi:hypothetical protein